MREPVKISEFSTRRDLATRSRVSQQRVRVPKSPVIPRARMLDGISTPIRGTFSKSPSLPITQQQLVPIEQSLHEPIYTNPSTVHPETHKSRPESDGETNLAGRSRFSKTQIALLTAAFVVFSLGIYASISTLKTNNKVEAQTQKLNNQKSNTGTENDGDHPDENDPGTQAVNNYHVDPTLPRKISITKLGVNSRIKPLGTKNTNELKAPSNIYDVGWYQGSAKPGGNGAMLLDGHVHGPTKKGVFGDLKKLVAGDIIDVERGDGIHFKYQVVRSQVFDKDNVDMASAITPVEDGKPGLNLITCTGSVDKASSTYNQRILIYASLAD